MCQRTFSSTVGRANGIVTSLTLALLLLTLLGSVTLWPPPVQAGNPIIYVDQNAGGEHDGTSWTDAYTGVQTALATAATVAPTETVEIWVAAGVYRPGTRLTDTFQLLNGVALYGGFDGTERRRDRRNWARHPTVLSGDIDHNDVTDTDGMITDSAAITGTNSRHVVTGSGTDSSAVLDGFTVTGGYANGGYSNANPADDLGGGMYNRDGSPTLANITFIGNAAFDRGGGMYNTDTSDPALTNVTFTGNVATLGGGMDNRNSSPTLTNVTFSRNSADYAGGMYNTSASHPILINATFTGNAADYGGGMINSESDPTLANVTFTGNTADYGGGMINWDGSRPTLTNVTFSGNVAFYDGGGMYNSSGHPTLANSIMWGNRDTGGTSRPAQIFNSNSTITMTHSLVQGDEYTGTGNISGDPLFVRAPDDGGDGWGDGNNDDYGDLRLQPGSPAIDAGNNARLPADHTDLDGDGDTVAPLPYDLAGNRRVADYTGNGEIVDMGAYEMSHMQFLPFLSR